MQPIGRIQREEKQLQGTTVFSSALSARFKDTPHPLSILACIQHPGKTPWSTPQVLLFYPRTAGPLTDLSDLTRAELTTFFYELGIVLRAMMTETSIAVTSIRISLGKAWNRYSTPTVKVKVSDYLGFVTWILGSDHELEAPNLRPGGEKLYEDDVMEDITSRVHTAFPSSRKTSFMQLCCEEWKQFGHLMKWVREIVLCGDSISPEGFEIAVEEPNRCPSRYRLYRKMTPVEFVEHKRKYSTKGQKEEQPLLCGADHRRRLRVRVRKLILAVSFMAFAVGLGLHLRAALRRRVK